MLAKVAEAKALRKAFPQDLGGLYTADEMQQAGPATDVDLGEPPKAPKRVKMEPVQVEAEAEIVDSSPAAEITEAAVAQAHKDISESVEVVIDLTQPKAEEALVVDKEIDMAQSLFVAVYNHATTVEQANECGRQWATKNGVRVSSNETLMTTFNACKIFMADPTLDDVTLGNMRFVLIEGDGVVAIKKV